MSELLRALAEAPAEQHVCDQMRALFMLAPGEIAVVPKLGFVAKLPAFSRELASLIERQPFSVRMTHELLP